MAGGEEAAEGAAVAAALGIAGILTFPELLERVFGTVDSFIGGTVGAVGSIVDTAVGKPINMAGSAVDAVLGGTFGAAGSVVDAALGSVAGVVGMATAPFESIPIMPVAAILAIGAYTVATADDRQDGAATAVGVVVIGGVGYLGGQALGPIVWGIL